MTTLSRRTFLGAAATTMGAATLGGLATGVASAQAAPKGTGLKVGMLTAPFHGETLEKTADFAKGAGISCLEVAASMGGPHFNLKEFGPAQAEATQKMLAARGVEISSLANYFNTIEEGKAEDSVKLAKALIDAAVLLKVPTVCMITGYAPDGMSKIKAIKTLMPPVFRPILDYAKEKGIRIALENYFRTCLQGLDTFDCVFETIADDNFGLNYDPSHLYHQECDHLVPVKKFAKRIFHTHAKDTLVDVEKRAYVGVYADGWWRYVIPGKGNINWAEYTSELLKNGYSGPLSIEHEDGSFGREEGFTEGARYLSQFCKA